MGPGPGASPTQSRDAPRAGGPRAWRLADADARPAQAFPPTGRRFATTQTHWFRIAERKVIEHWANRDDLGTAMQLGWTPPSPLYMLKMCLATRSVSRGASSQSRE